VLLAYPTEDDLEIFESLQSQCGRSMSSSPEQVISEWEATPVRMEVAVDSAGEYLDWAAVQEILLRTGRSRRGSVGKAEEQKKKWSRRVPSSVR
jgi:hypothetical protein